MDKLKMKSKDIISDNIDKIAELFPNVLTETKEEDGEIKRGIDFDLLQQELKENIVEGNKERYQMTWPGKKEAIVVANTPTNQTLRPVKEDSVNWENTENLYIEGDNLEVLKILQESYLNKIKCIYIDPPYNTGKDFIYRDNFTQGKEEYLQKTGQIDESGNRLFQNTDSNGRYHSDWLTMMYPRLKLARNLLTDDGVIFISIDDNEIHNLKKICDEIFGENNFVADICWHKKTQPSFLSKQVANVKESILFYKKNKVVKTFGGLTDVNKHIEMINISNDVSERILKKENVLIANGKFSGSIKKGIYGNGTLKIELLDNVDVVNGLPTKDLKLKGRFKWTQQTMNKSFVEKDTYHIKNTNSLRPTVEKQSKVANIKPIIDLFSKKISQEIPTNTDASNELKSLFEGINITDYPKPVNLVKYLVNSVTYLDKESIVLDFFSGSATTAHSVMQLNAEDSGSRKYIMVQLAETIDEKNEARKRGFETITAIGKERIRRAASKIKEETGAKIDYGFRVYKVDSSNMKNVYYTPQELSQDWVEQLESNIKEDRKGLDLLTQVMLDAGLELSLPITIRNIEGNEVHIVDKNKLVACFDSEIHENLIVNIAQIQPRKAMFRDNSFKSCPDKINLEEIFKRLSPKTELRVI